jgi:argininosuccinate lyase
MDFRTAHEIVSTAVKDLHGKYDLEKMASSVEQILLSHEPAFKVDPHILRTALTVSNLFDVRKIPGGPAAKVLNLEIERAQATCKQDAIWLEAKHSNIQKAADRRHLECLAIN